MDGDAGSRAIFENGLGVAIWASTSLASCLSLQRGMSPPVPSSPVYLRWTEGAALTSLRLVEGHDYRHPERPGGPLVFWEPRTAIDALELKGFDHHLQKWLQRTLSEDRTNRFIFTVAGAHHLDYRPSHRSAQRTRWLRQEVVMSTLAFMALLIWLATTLYKNRRHIAMRIVEQVMVEWLPASVKSSFLSCSEFRGTCPASISSEESCCRHGSRLAKLHLGGDDVSAPAVCRLFLYREYSSNQLLRGQRKPLRVAAASLVNGESVEVDSDLRSILPDAPLLGRGLGHYRGCLSTQ